LIRVRFQEAVTRFLVRGASFGACGTERLRRISRRKTGLAHDDAPTSITAHLVWRDACLIQVEPGGVIGPVGCWHTSPREQLEPSESAPQLRPVPAPRGMRAPGPIPLFRLPHTGHRTITFILPAP
jgi:hypothetical protein